MDLATARQEIIAALERLRAAYYRPVFDEWAIVALGAKHGGAVAYMGFRAAEFLEHFQADAALLRALVAARPLEVGEFDFVARAPGSKHDAAIKLGPGSYLVLNNTSKTMAELRTDPRWPHAEPVLAELAARFRQDPLEPI